MLFQQLAVLFQQLAVPFQQLAVLLQQTLDALKGARDIRVSLRGGRKKLNNGARLIVAEACVDEAIVVVQRVGGHNDFLTPTLAPSTALDPASIGPSQFSEEGAGALDVGLRVIDENDDGGQHLVDSVVVVHGAHLVSDLGL